MKLEDIYNYFHSYDKEVFQVFACQDNEPSEEDVAEFEASIGFSLPEEFREYSMSQLGGLYMEVRDEIWPKAKMYDVGPFWSFLRGIMVYGFSADVPENMDIRVQTSDLREDGVPELVPFMQRIGDEDTKYCFNKAGEIVLWSYEEPEEVKPVAMTFSELLMKEIKELEERKDKKQKGEDKH